MKATKDQEMFLLTHHRLMTLKQLAEELEVSRNTVRMWLKQLGVVKVNPKQQVESFNCYFRHDKNLATI